MRAYATFASVLLAPLFLHGALAGEPSGYPRVVGTGENASLEYGPGPINIVGGGAVMSVGRGEETELRYLDSQYVQRAPRGLVPVTRGSGESMETFWVRGDPEPTLTADLSGRD